MLQIGKAFWLDVYVYSKCKIAILTAKELHTSSSQ